MAQPLTATTRRKKKLSPIHPVAHDPTNGFISKAEFIEKRKKIRHAQQVAEKAYKDALEKELPGNPELAEIENKLSGAKQLLKTLMNNQNKTEKELEECADNEKKEIKRELKKIKNSIASTEEKISKLETEKAGIGQ